MRHIEITIGAGKRVADDMPVLVPSMPGPDARLKID